MVGHRSVYLDMVIVVIVVVVTVNGGSLLCTAGTQTDGQIFGDFINPQRSRNLEHDRTSKLFRKAMSTTTVGYALFCSCLLVGRPQQRSSHIDCFVVQRLNVSMDFISPKAQTLGMR